MQKDKISTTHLFFFLITPKKQYFTCSSSLSSCGIITMTLQPPSCSSEAEEEEVGPTKEVVIKALLDYFVDPLLPLKPSVKAPPPPLSQQQRVANQLHAVLLLYNYYHRKQHPEAEYLDFLSFSKLIVTLKPALLAHMKSVYESDSTNLNDLEIQLSVAEKAVVDACNLSVCLEGFRDVPSIHGWPISRVAVLLVDYSKENCFLLFSSTTDGAWSVIEKDVDHSSTSPENQVDDKQLNKRKRNSKSQSTSEKNANESAFQKLAFSAVKEATGIDRSDLVVVERQLTYSLSKEKTAACFYIMQCTQSTNQEFQVPLGYTIESLQGPLFKRSSACWTSTEVIEYYHLLPYAKIISSWFFRELSSVSSETLKACTVENNAEKEDSETGSRGVESLSILELGDIEIQKSMRSENPYQCVSNEESNNSANSSGQEGYGVKSSKRKRKRKAGMKESSVRSSDVENIFEKIIEGGNSHLHGSLSVDVKEMAVNISASKMSEALCSRGLKEELMNINVCGAQNAEAYGEANEKSSSSRKSCHAVNPSDIELDSDRSSENVGKEVVKGEKSDNICEVSESRNDNQISKNSKWFLSVSQTSDVVTDSRIDFLHRSRSARVKEMAVNICGFQMTETLCSQGLKEEVKDIDVSSSQNTEASCEGEANEKSSRFGKSCGRGKHCDAKVNGFITSQNVDKGVEKGEESDQTCEVSESKCENQISECSKMFLHGSKNSNIVPEGRKYCLHGSKRGNVKETADIRGSQLSETLCSQVLKEDLMDIDVSGPQNTAISGDREGNENCSSCCKSFAIVNPRDTEVSGLRSCPNVDKEVEEVEKSDRICQVFEGSKICKFLSSVSENSNVVAKSSKDHLHGSRSANVKETVVNISGCQMSGTLCSQSLNEWMVRDVQGPQNTEASGDGEANQNSFSCYKSCDSAHPSDLDLRFSSSQNVEKKVEKGEKSDKKCVVSEITKSSKVFSSVSQKPNLVTGGSNDYLHGSLSANVKEKAVNVNGCQMSKILGSLGLQTELMDMNVPDTKNTGVSGDKEANDKISSCRKSCDSATPGNFEISGFSSSQNVHNKVEKGEKSDKIFEVSERSASCHKSYNGANPSSAELNGASSSSNLDKEVENAEKSDRICGVPESRFDNKISQCREMLLSISENANIVMDLQITGNTLLKEAIKDRTSANFFPKEESGVNSSQGTEKERENFADICDITENSCEREIPESETAILHGIQDPCLEPEYLTVDDAWRTGKPLGMEMDEYNYSFSKKFLPLEMAHPRGSEATATMISHIRDKNVENRKTFEARLTGFTSKKLSGVEPDSSMQQDNAETLTNCLSFPRGKGVDDSSLICPKDDNEIMNQKMFKVYYHRKRKSRHHDTQASFGGGNIEVETAHTMKACETEYGIPVMRQAMVLFEPSANVDNQNTVLVLKKPELSQAALRVILRKREKMCNQKRETEDRLALCEESILRILDDNEDNLGLKIDTIIDCCSEVLFKDKTQMEGNSHWQSEDCGSIQSLKANRLSEAVVFGQFACQKLDDICSENSWLLPRYAVSVFEGGYLANVTLKGTDFELSCESVVCSSPSEARASAAAKMITKLWAMAAKTR